MDRVFEHDCWELLERGPDGARHRALLLPGGLCTAKSYEALAAQPALAAAGVATLAANPPGFAGRPVPEGFGYAIEEYAAQTEAVAATQGADLLVGHSLFANVLIEVAARGEFHGPVMLLGPCLRRSNELRDVRALDRAARIPGVGALAWWGTHKTLGISLREFLPRDRLPELVADMRRNPPRANRAIVSRYLDHLDKWGNLTDRLAGTTQPVWLVRGDREKVGFDDEDRTRLEAMANVELQTIAGAGHFSMLDAPEVVAGLILRMLGVD